MDICHFVLRQAQNKEFATFQGGGTNVDKVQQLLDMFDSLKNNSVIRPLILAWMNSALAKSVYSPIATVDIDVAKVKEFGRVIAFFEVDEIENISHK
jgi:hypothetical protein